MILFHPNKFRLAVWMQDGGGRAPLTLTDIDRRRSTPEAALTWKDRGKSTENVWVGERTCAFNDGSSVTLAPGHSLDMDSAGVLSVYQYRPEKPKGPKKLGPVIEYSGYEAAPSRSSSPGGRGAPSPTTTGESKSGGGSPIDRNTPPPALLRNPILFDEIEGGVKLKKTARKQDEVPPIPTAGGMAPPRPSMAVNMMAAIAAGRKEKTPEQVEADEAQLAADRAQKAAANPRTTMLSAISKGSATLNKVTTEDIEANKAAALKAAAERRGGGGMLAMLAQNFDNRRPGLTGKRPGSASSSDSSDSGFSDSEDEQTPAEKAAAAEKAIIQAEKQREFKLAEQQRRDAEAAAAKLKKQQGKEAREAGGGKQTLKEPSWVKPDAAAVNTSDGNQPGARFGAPLRKTGKFPTARREDDTVVQGGGSPSGRPSTASVAKAQPLDTSDIPESMKKLSPSLSDAKATGAEDMPTSVVETGARAQSPVKDLGAANTSAKLETGAETGAGGSQQSAKGEPAPITLKQVVTEMFGENLPSVLFDHFDSRVKDTPALSAEERTRASVHIKALLEAIPLTGEQQSSLRVNQAAVGEMLRCQVVKCFSDYNPRVEGESSTYFFFAPRQLGVQYYDDRFKEAIAAGVNNILPYKVLNAAIAPLKQDSTAKPVAGRIDSERIHNKISHGLIDSLTNAAKPDKTTHEINGLVETTKTFLQAHLTIGASGFMRKMAKHVAGKDTVRKRDEGRATISDTELGELANTLSPRGRGV